MKAEAEAEGMEAERAAVRRVGGEDGGARRVKYWV